MTHDMALEVKGLAVSYGGVSAVRGVDFLIRRGQVVALVGSNGAGKTSIMNALMKVHPGSSTQMKYYGEDVSAVRTNGLVERGMALVPEGRRLFPRMSVRENLQLGAFLRRDKLSIRSDYERVLDMFPALKQRLKLPAMALSGGQQQMVAIGRALMSAPRLLLLDEPTIGLAPAVVEQIGDTIRSISQEGVDVLLVEQNASVALSLSSYAYVIDRGNVMMSGTSAALASDSRVRAAYLGL